TRSRPTRRRRRSSGGGRVGRGSIASRVGHPCVRGAAPRAVLGWPGEIRGGGGGGCGRGGGARPPGGGRRGGERGGGGGGGRGRGRRGERVRAALRVGRGGRARGAGGGGIAVRRLERRRVLGGRRVRGGRRRIGGGRRAVLGDPGERADGAAGGRDRRLGGER